MNHDKKDPFNAWGAESDLADQLSGRYRFQWIDENFHVEKNGDYQKETIDRFHVGSSLFPRKILLIKIAVSLIFLIFAGRIFYLQTVRNNEFRVLAENNRQRIIPIPAERGLIFDRNGIQLVKNTPKFSLALIPQDLPRESKKREQIIDRLAELTKHDRGLLKEVVEKYGSYSYESIIISENLDYETALTLQIAASDLSGIYIYRDSKRLYYPKSKDTDADPLVDQPSSLSHILGYLGKLDENEFVSLRLADYLPSDSIGKTGLEKNYESTLRGKNGRKRIEVNALGREQTVIAEEPPMAGAHLKLSVDVKIQEKLEEILQSSIERNKLSKAVAVAIDPRNGELLALVSLPAFNNNDFAGGITTDKYQEYLADQNQPLFNRAIGGVYPSGSTIKPAIAAAALNEGIINEQTSFVSVGGLGIGSWWFPDWLSGGHGVTNVKKALASSVNTFFYYIGGGYGKFSGLGAEKIAAYLKKFGFAAKTGIDIPGEAAGFVPSKDWKQTTKGERWYIGDTYNLSIGQGDFLATPIQISVMTAFFANGGTLYNPRLVKTIADPLTNSLTVLPEQIRGADFVSKENISIVRAGMRQCVTDGSCRALNYLPFPAAGKTGTAQWSSAKSTHAWFTSFAPYDHPEIVVTILFEEGGEGSQTASPAAREFYEWWHKYRNTADL